ncbi:hypothetical protein DFH07DRAFT_902757 [Mycena maculata]|uniref:Uncharacterized protein n=1 Tax=Mycena maculata TaxID=230809 RepID=A0AAD7JID0_9AGAR|nr:hypothetical protein DFH07DRAFT_902757 [Mycena maculata]
MSDRRSDILSVFLEDLVLPSFQCLRTLLSVTTTFLGPSSPATVPAPSDEEAIFYYAGLPFRPAYPKIRELRAVGNHALKEAWDGNLALKLHALLDSMQVEWISTDVVRIASPGESPAPVILWVDVIPASLSGGVVVASKCQELLVEYGIADVEVEIPTNSYHRLPWAESTGGFFIGGGGSNKRLLLDTACHVVFPPDENENKHFKHKNDSQHRFKVVFFGDAAFNKCLESIKAKIKGNPIVTQYHEERRPGVESGREVAQLGLNLARKALPVLNAFYRDVLTHWTTPENRVLGHVILSPPIGAGSSGDDCAEDWAVIKIDASKLDASNLGGNAIDLTSISPEKFLSLKDTIPDEEMRHPTALDRNDDPCLMVIERGNTSGLTIGRPNTSKEWAILPRDYKSGAFSDKGDSAVLLQVRRLDITYAMPISFLLKCV